MIDLLTNGLIDGLIALRGRGHTSCSPIFFVYFSDVTILSFSSWFSFRFGCFIRKFHRRVHTVPVGKGYSNNNSSICSVPPTIRPMAHSIVSGRSVLSWTGMSLGDACMLLSMTAWVSVLSATDSMHGASDYTLHWTIEWVTRQFTGLCETTHCRHDITGYISSWAHR